MTMPLYFGQIHNADDVTIAAHRALRSKQYPEFADLIFSVRNSPALMKGIHAEETTKALAQLAKHSFEDFERTVEIASHYVHLQGCIKSVISSIAQTLQPDRIRQWDGSHFYDDRSGIAALNKLDKFIEGNPELRSSFDKSVQSYVDEMVSPKKYAELTGLSLTSLIAETNKDRKFDVLRRYITAEHVTQFVDRAMASDNGAMDIAALLTHSGNAKDIALQIKIPEKALFFVGQRYANSNNYFQLEKLLKCITVPDHFVAFKEGIIDGVEQAEKRGQASLKNHLNYNEELWGKFSWTSKEPPRPSASGKRGPWGFHS